jgi:hypothetical protein
MLVAERRANVVNQIQEVEDEQVLKMIEAILGVHLGLTKSSETEDPVFNPFDHHSEAAIKQHQARVDFWGYDSEGQPVFGDDIDKQHQESMAAVESGEIKLTTHEEFKAKMEKKLSGWRSRTK